MARRLQAPLMKDVDPPADEEEGNIPLIKAVAIEYPKDSDVAVAVATDAKPKSSTPDDDNRRVFQVTAPADLPKGYRLNVLVEGTNKEVVVLIPAGGVKRSQTFEGKEARPLTGAWSDGVFDCSPNYEGSFCSVAFCVPFIAWGVILEKLGCCDPTVAKLVPWFMGILTFLHIGLYALEMESGDGSSYLRFLIVLFIVCLATATRTAVRKKYKIPGSCFGDCICAYFCSCCTLLQSYRHMKRNGDTPCHGSSCQSCGDHVTLRAVQV